MPAEPGIFLAAGEASGDALGAALARELHRRMPGARVSGLGGSGMRGAGVELLADLDRLAVLGFTEVARRLPDLYRLRRTVERHLAERRVELLVAIDYPGFNLPLAAHARRRGISVLWYVVPQVWAWRAGRSGRLARVADEICAILPFEPDFLARHGARATFVGHPLLDAEPPGRVEARDGVDRRPCLGLFPGSRAQEVQRMLPEFLAAAELLRRDLGDLDVRIARSPDLPEGLFAGCEPAVVAGPRDVLRAADAAIAKSGTITLELALAEIPMAVGYRTSPATFALARRLVRVSHISLVNLVAGREIVPERIQHAMTAGSLAADVRPLLDGESKEAWAMRAGLGDVRDRLGSPGAAARVAAVADRLLRERSGR